jgi:hypothetical protein
MCNSYLTQISFFVNFWISDILNKTDIKKTIGDGLQRILNLRIAMRAAFWRYSNHVIVSCHPHLRHVPTVLSQADAKVARTKLPSMLRKLTIQCCCLWGLKVEDLHFRDDPGIDDTRKRDAGNNASFVRGKSWYMRKLPL